MFENKNQLFLSAIKQSIWHSLRYPKVRELSADYAEFPYPMMMA